MKNNQTTLRRYTKSILYIYKNAELKGFYLRIFYKGDLI